MAPPSKRRKLFGTAYTSMSQEPRLSAQTTIAGFSHVIEHIPQPHFTAPPFSLRVEEVHVLQVEQQAALDRRGTVHKRQGTGSAAEAILGVTVVAKVASDGSTTALTTTTDASASLGILAFAGTTTVTSLISPVPSSSLVSAGVAGTSSLSATASSSAKAAGVAGATGSGASSASGSGSSAASSTGLASSSNANTGEGVIGNTPSRAVASSSSAPANGTAGSVRISGTASALSPAVITGSSAAPANLTTSDTILISGSHTTTSRTTLNLASLNTSTNLRFAAAFYLTTISGSGSTTRVETVSRASTAYPTTFSDGVVLTVSAATGSYVTTTAADGATSTFFMTVTPSASTGTSGPSTIFSTTTPSSPSSSNSGANSAASSLTADGAGAAGSQTSTTTSAASSANSHNSNNNTSPAGTIAGGVVGGAAGLAVILIAMLFLRWYRRKAALGGGGGHQALRPNIGTLDREDPILSSRQGPGMAERAGLMPAFAAVPALFRHQNRSRESGPGTGTLTTASGPAGTGSERGFTRVSGRKLPSEFSPGMSSQGPPPPPPPPPRPNPSRMPMRSGYGAVDARDPSTFFYRASGASFYSDEHEGGAAGAAGTAAAAGDEGLTLSPGPQRKPTLHEGGHYRMSSPTAGQGPFADPLPGSAGVVESPTGPVGGKGSKFTEQV